MRKFRHPAQLVPKWAALPAASSSSATTAFYHSHSQGGALPASTSSSSFAPAPHATRLARPDLSPASKGRPLDAILAASDELRVFGRRASSWSSWRFFVFITIVKPSPS